MFSDVCVGADNINTDAPLSAALGHTPCTKTIASASLTSWLLQRADDSYSSMLFQVVGTHLKAFFKTNPMVYNTSCSVLSIQSSPRVKNWPFL